MINKKNVLGKQPDELGTKDAIHTAIVSVRAGSLIRPGQRCKMNEFNEAVPDSKGVGVADPFWRNGNITVGQEFWLLLAQDEVPNVQHVWEHPSVDFSPPSRPVEKNSALQRYADRLGVTYEQLIEACDFVFAHNEPAKYPGNKSAEEVEWANDPYELWPNWAAENGHAFDNQGTECCPEYDYPDCRLFSM